MSEVFAKRDRLLMLLDSVCDQRASAADYAEIEQIVLSSPAAMQLYLRYTDLHGTLIWDTAGGLEVDVEEPVVPVPVPVRQRKRVATVMAAVCAALLLGVLLGRQFSGPPLEQQNLVQQNTVPTNPEAPERRDSNEQAIAADSRRPVELPGMTPTSSNPVPADSANVVSSDSSGHATPSATESVPSAITPAEIARSEAGPSRQEAIVAAEALLLASPQAVADGTAEDDVTRVARQIDRELALAWYEHDLKPTPRSSDTEWLRRVMLSLTGRIPTVDEVEAFTANNPASHLVVRGDRRRALVDQLLADGAHVRHFSTVWMNLLIGRSPGPEVNREAFRKYLRHSFAANQPWNSVVAELLSAEGQTHENGATNYLVAHLNNQAVPATAITSRLFLGQQLHCAQCHNHPFNEVSQAAFWELNSLFQQTKIVRSGGGRMSPRQGPAIASLVTAVEGGPIYYESTNGLMKVAFPRFNGQDVDPAPEVNRRVELARLLQTTDQPQLAAAFVNRMWAHFFGAGFTTPVDDMGPHNPPCHPEVLNLLRDEFVRSGYDVQQLIRVITATDAYQRGSATSEANRRDDPTTGDIPLFSRVYPQPLTAEQLYDSLVVATQAHQSGATDWEAAEKRRQAWLEEFVVSLENDENDEAETLSGTYAQALTLMNGDLMQKALDLSPGTFLGDLMRSRLPEADRIDRLYLAALSRKPQPKELAAVQRLLRDGNTPRRTPATSPRNPAVPYQDLFWALLNSNEFAIAH